MDHRRFLGHFLPCQGVLRGFLLAATGRPQDADDLLQEVSSVLWEKFDAYDESRPFRAWALGVARLEVLNWKRRLARSRELLSDEALDALAQAGLETADAAEQASPRLASCLRTLTRRVREALRMRYFEGLPIARVAERIGKSVAAVEMLLVRSRRALRHCVESRSAP